MTNGTTTNPNLWSVTVQGGFQSALISGNNYRFISRATDNARNSEFRFRSAALTRERPKGKGVQG